MKFLPPGLGFDGFNKRTPRTAQRPVLAGYPATVRRIFFWYDSLTDCQRLRYVAVAILFLLACGGYLLGLGSAIVLARVDAEEAALAAAPLPTLEVEVSPTATELPSPTATTLLSPTAVSATLTPIPTSTPFSVPLIAEPPAAPRQLPAAPAVIAPAAPAPVRATPTVARPRNLETTKPEPPAASLATPTAAVRVVRTTLPASQPTSRATAAIRQATLAPTTVGVGRPVQTQTVLPTLAIPPTTAPTPVTRRPAQATPVKTPTPVR